MAPPHPQQTDHDGSMVSSTSLTMISKRSTVIGDMSLAGYTSPIIDSTHSDSDSSSLTVVVSSASDNTKNRKRTTTRKSCKYKYPRTIVEGKKMIIRGKAPLVQSGKEIYEKLKNKALCKKQAENRKKTNADVKNGSQRTIFNMFDKSTK
eukprot:scaffold63885_cov54-Attheya_sp.AAC.6